MKDKVMSYSPAHTYQVTCHCKRIGGTFVLHHPTPAHPPAPISSSSSTIDAVIDTVPTTTVTTTAPPTKVIAWECNCSDCSMRGNVHIIIPKSDFQILMPKSKSENENENTNKNENETFVQQEETFEEATTLYEWGTMTAKRRFCKTCGILPWYIPRSNPDGVAITLNCIVDFDWDDGDGGGDGGGDGDGSGDADADADVHGIDGGDGDGSDGEGKLMKMKMKQQQIQPKVIIKKFDGIHWE